MRISAPPVRLSFEAYPARRPEIGFLCPVLAYALVALLAVGGALLLAAHGITPPGPGGEDPAAALDVG